MNADSNHLWQQLDEELQRLMEIYGIPGVAVGVLQDGEVRTHCAGVTNVDHPLPVTPETLFQIGSITKTFVGTLAMRLQEMGMLDMDARVRSYLPEFQVQDETASGQATLRHLFTHTAGWEGDVFLDTGLGEEALAKYVEALANCPQLAPLGSHFSYNNAGFSLAGRIIEQVTGTPFETAMQKFVLGPLGLTSATLEPTEAMLQRFVVGHKSELEGPSVAAPWPLPRSARPAGGVICNVLDLLRYARFHLDRGVNSSGDRLLSEQSIAQMQQPLVQLWGEDETWGLTWAVRRVQGVKVISHNGGVVGQQTLLNIIPERNFGLAIFTNSDRGSHLYNPLRRWVLRRFQGLEYPLPEPQGAAPAELAPYAGRYSRPYADWELALLNGRLVGQMLPKKGFPDNRVVPPPPPPMTFDLCGEDRLIILDGPMQNSLADIIRQPDGSIGWLRLGRLHQRQGV